MTRSIYDAPGAVGSAKGLAPTDVITVDANNWTLRTASEAQSATEVPAQSVDGLALSAESLHRDAERTVHALRMSIEGYREQCAHLERELERAQDLAARLAPAEQRKEVSTR